MGPDVSGGSVGRSQKDEKLGRGEIQLRPERPEAECPAFVYPTWSYFESDAHHLDARTRR
ncbi:hypothetical protein ACPOL_1444 [Acidisarcina polymorpha]|uniref:Uncharacterized protein n=1 Tax=Acidisarcina polymorpha TaxID=2211140 RepID=A0A2Z5FVM0_9BACT|nr:hypothetical protein ACPOL_1444 [Acidisarcina polymorpha]